MKRLFAAAAVCATLTGLLTGCSGTNYTDSYNTRDGMAYDGYYDGRNSTIYGVTEGDMGGRTENGKANRNTGKYATNDGANTDRAVPRSNTSTTAR